MDNDIKDICPACSLYADKSDVTINGYKIVKCNNCYLRFVSNYQLLKGADYNDFYSPGDAYNSHLEEASKLISGQQVLLPRARRVALRQIAKLKPSPLLEIGCGVGSFLSYIEKMGIESYGIDISENAISLAAKHLKCSLFSGTLTDKVFPGKFFEVITLWEVLEHVIDLRGLMSELYQRLVPGGWIFLSTPNYDSKWLWKDLPNDPRSRPPVHVTFWNKYSLKNYLLTLGFNDVTVRHFSIPASAANRSFNPFKKRFVYFDAILRPYQRATLLASAKKPNI
jgi:2-polyprenyl-3-methyl-5-hydroxy-6-metoxy-1,4-benzoquinol methylase